MVKSSPKRRTFASPASSKRPALSPRKSPSQERAKETVEALQEAALQVLQKEGFTKLTTTRVAARAGVSVGTLYQYFPNKAALGRALILRYLRGMGSAITEAAQLPGPPLEQLCNVARAFIAYKTRYFADSLALRSVSAEVRGDELTLGVVRDAVTLLTPTVQRILPGSNLAEAERHASFVVMALHGVALATVDIAPQQLTSASFVPALEDLIHGYFARVLARRAALAP